jgi:tetratricopeptide (TPR) repeat protein
MNRHRVAGAISFPALLLVWSIGAVLAFSHLEPAAADPSTPVDGAKVPSSPGAAIRKTASRGDTHLTRHKSLAREELQAGRFADAYHRLRPNVADARGDGEFLALLALAALRIGSYGEAMVIYEHLAQREPDGGRWHVGLALAREGLGLDATSVYRQALALSDAAGEIRVLLRAKLADETAAGLG